MLLNLLRMTLKVTGSYLNSAPAELLPLDDMCRHSALPDELSEQVGRFGRARKGNASTSAEAMRAIVICEHGEENAQCRELPPSQHPKMWLPPHAACVHHLQ